ncbi:hypothetical protein [Streptomyces sp. A0592]|uniref:hypothetical protein n=1 Tax=Streptomyces sp. A0592 TaxID=2563099 RepID=UPI001F0D9966|nr:hypothetical protein [Streptomyces sp. A0592]
MPSRGWRASRGGALDLVRRCLAKDPAGRPTTAALVAELSAGSGGLGGARPDGSAWLPPAVAGSLLVRASSALEADTGPTGYEPTRVDPAPVPGPAGGPREQEPPGTPSTGPDGRTPRPAGPRARLRTAPVLAAAAVVVAAAIGALAYTAG